MADSKHTPGPWTAAPSKYAEGVLVVKAGMPSNRVLARFGSDAEPLDETDEANARLIAAAPDLLAALLAFIPELEQRERFISANDSPWSQSEKDMLDRIWAARKAVAKAGAA
jgi:hypothetical protein